MNDIECPYCGKDLEINHDDGYGYEEGRIFQQECSFCEKTFTYTTSISFDYYAEQADCLNGGEHDYKISYSYPREYSRMKCTMCDGYRELTKEEKEELMKKEAE